MYVCFPPDLWRLVNPRYLIACTTCKSPRNFRPYASLADVGTFSLTPLLINRAAISLKKSADIDNKGSLAWNTHHFSSARFRSNFHATASSAITTQPSDDLTATRANAGDHGDIPLDEFTHDYHVESRSPTKRSLVVSQSMA